jgi:hypothetical protein
MELSPHVTNVWNQVRTCHGGHREEKFRQDLQDQQDKEIENQRIVAHPDIILYILLILSKISSLCALCGKSFGLRPAPAPLGGAVHNQILIMY